MFRNRKSYTMKYIPSYIPRIISITMLLYIKDLLNSIFHLLSANLVTFV